jgi:hypothetical protein
MKAHYGCPVQATINLFIESIREETRSSHGRPLPMGQQAFWHRADSVSCILIRFAHPIPHIPANHEGRAASSVADEDDPCRQAQCHNALSTARSAQVVLSSQLHVTRALSRA